MEKRSLLKLIVSFFSIGGVLIFSIIFFLIYGLPVQGFYTKPVASRGVIEIATKQINNTSLQYPDEVKVANPIRLKIPKIKVDTALEYVGLTPQGAMGIPKSPSKAAWFNLGPRPGEIGSAVIDGHYGVWKNGKKTVFNNLDKLRKGDKVYIIDQKGAVITFVVRESKSYNSKMDATDVFISGDGKSHLNLITCKGVWNKVTKSYSRRLVVFTDRE